MLKEFFKTISIKRLLFLFTYSTYLYIIEKYLSKMNNLQNHLKKLNTK